MDKLILCLANSYKHGGRCIAGIEIQINENKLIIIKSNFGVPVWIRPISHSVAGEVPLEDAKGIRILSIVKIYNAQYAGNASHSEDYYYERLQLLQTLNPSDEFLQEYIDTWHGCIFGNRGRALTPNAFQCGDYSLMLIRTEGSEIYLDTRYTPKPRIKFTYKGTNYDFPITDPIFLHKLDMDNSLYKSGYGILYIVASLGVEHDGWHSKLAASIILPAESNIEEIVSIQNLVSPNAISILNTTVSETNVAPSSTRVNVLHSTSMEPITNSHTEFKSTLSSSTRIGNRHPPRSRKGSRKSGCYIATAIYGSYDCPEVWTLRRYRDLKLTKTLYGRIFVHIYYVISPLFVKWFGHTKVFRRIWKRPLDCFVNKLQAQGFKNTPYKDKS